MEFAATAAGAPASATVSEPTVRICRFYVSVATPFANSHFYGREDTDCETTGDPVRDGAGIPSIAVGEDGRLHVVWQDARFGRGGYDAVAYAQSRDGGLTWSTPVAVNARLDVAAFTPTVHVRSDGTIGVAYCDFRADTTDRTTLPTVYRLATSTDAVN